MDDEQTVDVIEQTLSDYLDEVDPDDIDTQVLAENIARNLTRGDR